MAVFIFSFYAKLTYTLIYLLKYLFAVTPTAVSRIVQYTQYARFVDSAQDIGSDGRD